MMHILIQIVFLAVGFIGSLMLLIYVADVVFAIVR